MQKLKEFNCENVKFKIDSKNGWWSKSYIGSFTGFYSFIVWNSSSKKKSNFFDAVKGVFRRNKIIRTILKIENVLSVISKNINQKKKDFFLDFLTIETKQMTDKTYEMNLIFSGNSIIKINAEVIEVFLDDQGLPWDSKNKPTHVDL